MRIAAGTVVTLAYDLTTESGEIVESSDISGAVSFLHGQGAIIKGLDGKLEGLEEGAEETFSFPPEEAFGRVEDSPTKPIPRAEFPEGIPVEVGANFEAGLPGGQAIRLQVQEVTDENVIVQMIHPLAGQTISMSIKIVGVREATAKEKEAGRALTKPPPPPPKK